MGHIADVKQSLHDSRVLEILAQSQYMPTAEKVRALADTLQEEDRIEAYGWFDECLNGVLVIRQMPEGWIEIVGIATGTAARGQGIGSRLIAHAAALHPGQCLRAETDDDAVGFYRKFGFDITSLGEKYKGIVRYLCVYENDRSVAP